MAWWLLLQGGGLAADPTLAVLGQRNVPASAVLPLGSMVLLLMSASPQAHLPMPQQATACITAPLRARGLVRSSHAAADALVVWHLPYAAKVAVNHAHRTRRPQEDIESLALIGLIKALRPYCSTASIASWYTEGS